jgi:hypothetical protein
MHATQEIARQHVKFPRLYTHDFIFLFYIHILSLATDLLWNCKQLT